MIILKDRLFYSDSAPGKGHLVDIVWDFLAEDGVLASKRKTFASLKGALSNTAYRICCASPEQITCWLRRSEHLQAVRLPTSGEFDTRAGQALSSALVLLRASALHRALQLVRAPEEEVEQALDYAWQLVWRLAHELDAVLLVYMRCDAELRKAHAAFTGSTTLMSTGDLYRKVRELGLGMLRVQSGSYYDNAQLIRDQCRALCSVVGTEKVRSGQIQTALCDMIALCAPGPIACRTDMLALALGTARRLKVVLDADTLTLVCDGLIETTLFVEKLTDELHVRVTMPKGKDFLWQFVGDTQAEEIRVEASTTQRVTAALIKMRQQVRC